MATPYDSYNYSQYWRGREYENLAEEKALKRLLKNIPPGKSLIDIGAGFGRHTQVYLSKFQKIVLIDASSKLLELAKKKFRRYPQISYKNARIEKIPFKSNQFDVALVIRVSHHLPSLEKPFKEISRILKPQGFLILEFANKTNLKRTIKSLLKRDFSFLLSHRPVNLSSQNNLAFYNYHHSHIKSLLLSNHFKIIKAVSVSNFRNRFLKKIFPLKILLWLEFHFSLLTSFFPFHFGPSIFILAQKKGSSPRLDKL
ncbi:class I SAM-dependent methyltransferase [Patescibacteria group bacterium]